MECYKIIDSSFEHIPYVSEKKIPLTVTRHVNKIHSGALQKLDVKHMAICIIDNYRNKVEKKTVL